jgi:hypothetical protein
MRAARKKVNRVCISPDQVGMVLDAAQRKSLFGPSPMATKSSIITSLKMLDFPAAPKLDVFGKLDPAKATPAEIRGQGVFFGKRQ